MATAAATRPRKYHSPLREQRAAETRATLLEAARRLFVERGWAGTGMREVASEAGVATETLYAHFSSKRALLRGVVDVAVAGDEEPIAVADRPEFIAIGRGSHHDRCAAAALLLRHIYERTGPVRKVIRQAAASDPEMADELHETRERQRRDVAASAPFLFGRKPTPTERDGLWALTSPEIYELLVDVSGWTPARYETWMTDALERLRRSAPASRRKGM